MDQLTAQASELDQALQDGMPILTEDDLENQALLRAHLADLIRNARTEWNPSLQSFFQTLQESAIQPGLAGLEALAAEQDLVSNNPLAPALAARIPDGLSGEELDKRIASLEEYLPVATKWFRHFQFGKTKAAREALAPFGFKLSAGTVEQGIVHYRGLHATTPHC